MDRLAGLDSTFIDRLESGTGVEIVVPKQGSTNLCQDMINLKGPKARVEVCELALQEALVYSESHPTLGIV